MNGLLRNPLAHLSKNPGHALLWGGLIVFYSLGLFWGLPSITTSASDSIAPLGPLAFAADFHDPNKSYIYPAIHQILLLIVYAITLVCAKLTGAVGAISGAWPYGFHNPTAIFSVLLFLSNLVSMAMALGVLVCFHQIRIFEPSRRWFGVALLGLSGVFTY
ncbi:MAG: hypothetical protein ACRD4E_18635, partial [Bryobacteraceae bacterium]